MARERYQRAWGTTLTNEDLIRNNITPLIEHAEPCYTIGQYEVYHGLAKIAAIKNDHPSQILIFLCKHDYGHSSQNGEFYTGYDPQTLDETTSVNGRRR